MSSHASSPRFNVSLASAADIDPIVLAATLSASDAASDPTRLQLLLRVLELEKRLVRAEERARTAEESLRSRVQEVAQQQTLSSERTATWLNRLNAAEAATSECAISVQQLQQRVDVDFETSLSQLRMQVQAWRDEMRREFADEFSRTIQLRNSLHHSEIATILEKHNEQHLKIIQTHDLTADAFAQKISAVEAKLSAQTQNVHQAVSALHEQHVEAQRRVNAVAGALDGESKQTRELLQAQATQLAQVTAAVERVAAELASSFQHRDAQQVSLQHDVRDLATRIGTLEGASQTLRSHLDSTASTMESRWNTATSEIGEVRATQAEMLRSHLSAQDSLNAVAENVRADIAGLRAVVVSKDEHAQRNEEHNRRIGTLQQDILQVAASLSQKIDAQQAEQQNALQSALQPLQSEIADLRQVLQTTNEQMEAHRRAAKRQLTAFQALEEQFTRLQASTQVANEQAPLQQFLAQQQHHQRQHQQPQMQASPNVSAAFGSARASPVVARPFSAHSPLRDTSAAFLSSLALSPAGVGDPSVAAHRSQPHLTPGPALHTRIFTEADRNLPDVRGHSMRVDFSSSATNTAASQPATVATTAAPISTPSRHAPSSFRGAAAAQSVLQAIDDTMRGQYR